ncbi:MAG: hypothetical protein R6V12_18835 [Candidatus Hydrogenedentota bacterium]
MIRIPVLAALLVPGILFSASAGEAVVDGAVPILYRRVAVPNAFLRTEEIDGKSHTYGGDVRMGDLTGNGRVDFVVYRSMEDAHDGGGMKPCFMGAFSLDGEVLWTIGEGGTQPTRPGPVAIHDIDGDGASEVIHFFHDKTIAAPPTSMRDVTVQIREGKTGELEREAAPEAFTQCSGRGPNWCHQRILIANFRGLETPRDFVVKLGATLVAFDEKLDVLWSYTCPWTEYAKCPAYIPAVGDIDGDGRDEVLGGYYLLEENGVPVWERQLGRNMDSVAITEWDGGNVRAICSGFGHVLDAEENVLLKLGPDRVPHGQEVRVARFVGEEAEPQMVLRWNGHTPEVIVVDTDGEIVNEFELNESPNNTGMEPVYWHGPDKPAVLYNGGMLWNPITGEGIALPELPKPERIGRMSWYHCVAANVCGDAREEVVLYNPWERFVYIYTPAPLNESAFADYTPGPRQYNARIMD